MNYHTICGTKLQTVKEGVEWYCPHCKRSVFANPVPVTDAMLFDETGKILLGKRKNEPFKGKLNLPGGFVEMNETLEQAVAREINEELGLDESDYGKLTFASSRVDTHTGRQLIVSIFVGHIAHTDFKTNEEVDEYVWMLPADLKPGDLSNENEYEHIAHVVKNLPSTTA